MAVRNTEWPVRLATESWLFHSFSRCRRSSEPELQGEWTEPIRFADRFAALGWLRRFRSNALALRELRGVVAARAVSPGVWQLREDALLEYVAGLLGSGAWHVHLVPRPKIAGGTRQEAAAPEPRPVTPPKKAPGESLLVEILEELETFSPLTDGQATAAVLRAASVSGVPFCEECAKAAALRAAAS